MSCTMVNTTDACVGDPGKVRTRVPLVRTWRNFNLRDEVSLIRMSALSQASRRGVAVNAAVEFQLCCRYSNKMNIPVQHGGTPVFNVLHTSQTSPSPRLGRPSHPTRYCSQQKICDEEVRAQFYASLSMLESLLNQDEVSQVGRSWPFRRSVWCFEDRFMCDMGHGQRLQ